MLGVVSVTERDGNLDPKVPGCQKRGLIRDVDILV